MKQQSAIMQMLYGERGQRASIKRTKTEEELFDEINRFDSTLRKHLSPVPETLEIYERIHNLKENIIIELTNKYYTEGFKFGLLMGIEIVEKE